MSNVPPKRNLRNVVLFQDDQLSTVTTTSETNLREKIVLPPEQ